MLKDELVLECGSSKIQMKKDGTIQIKGKDITVDGLGKIVMSASSEMDLKGSKINQNS